MSCSVKQLIVHLLTLPTKHLLDVRISSLLCQIDWKAALHIYNVHNSAVGEQHLYYGTVPVARGMVQWCGAIVVSNVWSHAIVKEQREYRGTPSTSCSVQRCASFI